jgi:hypothetical protein
MSNGVRVVSLQNGRAASGKGLTVTAMVSRRNIHPRKPTFRGAQNKRTLS